MMRRLIQIVLLGCLTLIGQCVLAQRDEIGEALPKVSSDEAKQLRAILSEPLPEGAPPETLRANLRARELAAQRLGELEPLLNVFRQWQRVMPSTVPWNNFANTLDLAGDYEQALLVRKQLVDATAVGVRKEYYRNNYVGELIGLGKFDDAKAAIEEIFKNLNNINIYRLSNDDAVMFLRTEAETTSRESVLERLFGHYDLAIEKGKAAVSYARRAFMLENSRVLQDDNPVNKARRLDDVSSSVILGLDRLVTAQTLAGKIEDAENTCREFQQFIHDLPISARYFNSVYIDYADLRLNSHEFGISEYYYRKAEALSESLGRSAKNPERTKIRISIIASLEGQHRWMDALKELSQLDEIVGDDLELQKQVQYPFERGIAYLHSNEKLADAVDLFKILVDRNTQRYPEHHFFVAQANGLEGVGLWRLGDTKSQTQALSLLRRAVQDYMLPDNIDLETLGLRKDVKDLIFSTFLEASFKSSDGHPSEAMAPADWVRGGLVQEALADAAIRSSASNPALANLVRSDQDAKHEIEALRKFLAGEAGGAASPLPEIAAKMRSRIDELDKSRVRLQSDLKDKFPDYEKLVRPKPPSTTDVEQALYPDEALLMLLPTDNAVYVWVVRHDGKNIAIRVALSTAELVKLVGDMRKTLDFAEMANFVRPFNAPASSTLYEKLLMPVEAAFAGKQHLVVAAGGVLGQVPFGVLLTRPELESDGSSPWLIKQAAITHIPSLSAWLAVKQFAKSKSASESLVAWGDPQFNTAPVASSDNRSNSGMAIRRVALVRASVKAELEQENPGGAIKYSDIPALPDTRDELKAIAEILRADPIRDLHLGARASKASVLDSNKSGELIKKRVIAFATHGLMAGDLPHLSQPALALAGTGNEDKDPLGALLTLDEVLNLKLNADWVILSACNSAAADGRADEAMSGLARGFFYAGSRSLLVTHWSVESESARLITTSTMAHYMSNPKERKAESLRQAMLTVMKNPQYQHPAYWAPYALVGDGGR